MDNTGEKARRLRIELASRLLGGSHLLRPLLGKAQEHRTNAFAAPRGQDKAKICAQPGTGLFFFPPETGITYSLAVHLGEQSILVRVAVGQVLVSMGDLLKRVA